MKLLHQQSRNLKWLILALMLLFAVTCTTLFAQQATKQALTELDRSRFSLTAQNIEYANESQVGWDYLKSPILASLNNKGLFIHYSYRDYRVAFPLLHQLDK